MATTNQDQPKVRWDDLAQRWIVDLPMGDDQRAQAEWNQSIVTVIRIREVGTSEWSPGFVTPLNTCSFRDLKPCTEYEVELKHSSPHGDSSTVVKRLATKGGDMIA